MKNSTIISSAVFICLFLILALPATLKIHKQYPTLAHLYFGKTLSESLIYIRNPNPDEITLTPSVKITSSGKYKYETWKLISEELVERKNAEPYESKEYHVIEHKNEKEKDALRIVKRNGTYYWDSNGGAELISHTTDQINLLGRKGIYTIFVALNGSGLIAIKNDEFESRGECNRYKSSANYIEIRANNREIYYGVAGYYPPVIPTWFSKNFKYKRTFNCH